jgi:tetratricopeptide (TPR) repeat protein/TolB-like protein
MECPKCHSDNGADSLYCRSCGSSLSPPGPSPPGEAPPGDTRFRQPEPVPTVITKLTVGSTFAGRYRITQHLGRGGMGVVYRAEDVRLKRPVALKFLPLELTWNAAAKERFVHEAQAASALDHPNICTIYEVDRTPDGQMFITMAFCEGESLKDRAEQGPVAVEEALDIAIRVCDGLAAAHRAGMIHRDIKPANIMVKDAEHVRIVDFGLAKLTGQTQLTMAGTVLGTVDYMAPEQARGDDVDARADIWAVGVVLYEMLAGRAPFRGGNQQAVIHSILHSNPEPVTHVRRGVPVDLWKVIERCLRRDPAERYQTVAELQTELKVIRGVAEPAGAAVGHGLARRRPRWVMPRLRPDPRKTGMVLGVAALAVILLGVLPPREPLLTVQATRPWVRLWIGPQPLPPEKYLAVLPFETTPGEPDRTLCDGLIEVNARKLVRIASSADSFWVVRSEDVKPDTLTTPREALDKLAVNLVMSGGVKCSGDTITLEANLIDTKTMRRLRHFTISDPMANLATWQDDLILRMARMLGVSLVPQQVSLLKTGCTNVPAAYRPYLRGCGCLYPLEGKPQPDSAIAAFGRAIAEDPAFARAYVEMGHAYAARYDNTKDKAWLDTAAVWSGKAAVVSDPVPAAAFWGAGKIELARKRYSDALRDFKRAAELDGGCFEAYEGMGQAYDEENEPDSAAAAFAQAIRLQPRSYSAYNRLGYLYYKRREYEKAVNPFRVLTTLRPKRSTGYINLGATYFALDSLPEAQVVFERSLEFQRTYSVLSNLGTIYFYEGRYAKADSAYKEALKLSSRSPSDDYRVYGNDAEACYWIPGQRDTARAMFARAARLAEEKLAKTPGDLGVMADLASYLSMVDDRAGAEALLARVIGRNPSDSSVLDRIAETYEQLGSRDQALIWLDKALAGGYPIKYVEQYPNWRNLRSDERFRDLRQRYRSS